MALRDIEAARAYAREYQKANRLRPEVRERFKGYIKKYKENHLSELREKARIRDRRNKADPVAKKRVGENARRNKVKLKTLIIEKYSAGTMKCALCEEHRLPCLSIDHINGGGGAHRKALRMAGESFYRWLKSANFPGGYRVLCMNCQFICLDEMRRRKREL